MMKHQQYRHLEVDALVFLNPLQYAQAFDRFFIKVNHPAKLCYARFSQTTFRRVYLETYRTRNNVLLSFTRARPNQKIGLLPALCYNRALSFKGFLLESSIRLGKLATSSPQATEINNTLKGYRRQLAKEYNKPITERENILELKEKINTLEKRLAYNVSGYTEAIRQVQWQEVQSKLKAGDVAIEFTHFKINFPSDADITIYAALLLRPYDSIPIFLPLFDEKQLLLALRRPDIPIKEKINDVYRGKALYSLIWQPLEPYLKDVKTVHFSPSGLLHSIAFSAIPTPEKGQYLADRYILLQYGSTRDLVTRQKLYSTAVQNARVYGGIRYDSTDITNQRCDDHLYANSRRGGLSYLPCSVYEMKQVGDVLKGKGLKTDMVTGFEATEESMKPDRSNLTVNYRSPDLLHISTHGSYLAKPSNSDSAAIRPLFLDMDSPLARSFLAFAHSAAAFRGQPEPGAEDGLLTAFEISGLDLSGTKLAVLSACKTALGDIQGSEGVYGLQRAFKIAGVEHLVVSLWEVEDSGATIDFMTTFYRHFFNGMEVRDAFARTQKEMRDKYKKPYLWAAFVLI